MSDGQLPVDIDARGLAKRLRSDADFAILDVREPSEVDLVSLKDARVLYAPLSRLVKHGLAALPDALQDKVAKLVVICHFGERSAHVAGWLYRLGWKQIANLTGGLDAYAREVDPTLSRY
ncbi:MAG TPA: rhodanese-like domain-containing protein [Longilinea sp.]|nr:rhodanese-like domain-containing protein [Longilinea sp.]